MYFSKLSTWTVQSIVAKSTGQSIYLRYKCEHLISNAIFEDQKFAL